jgi:hypothetical protein
MRSSRFLSTRLVLATLITAAFAAPAAAQATTMTVGSNLFPSGAPAPDAVTGKVHVTPGSLVTLTAPQYLYQAATKTSPAVVYEFIFWDAGARLRTTETAIFRAPSSAAFYADAWYIATGGGPCLPGETCAGVSTWAFSLAHHRVLSQTPIASVTPALAWTAGSNNVSTTDAATLAAGKVTITSQPKLSLTPPTPPPPAIVGGYYSFQSWYQFGGNGTIAGGTLTVPADGSSASIAFYSTVPHRGPPKPPCGGFGQPPCPPTPM